jgi:hypothetical protein
MGLGKGLNLKLKVENVKRIASRVSRVKMQKLARGYYLKRLREKGDCNPNKKPDLGI